MNLRHALRWYPALLKDLVLRKLKRPYVPKDFWEQRHAAEHTFWTVGRRAFDEQGNTEWYGRLAHDLVAAFEARHLDLKQLAVYEIGAGTGYWTTLVRDLGCTRYQGTDIAESAIAWLRPKFPGYAFAVRDAAEEPIPGAWDVILMIHVDEHIHGPRFDATLRHIRAALASGGHFFTTYSATPKASGVNYVEYHGIIDYRRVFPADWITALPQPNGGDPLLCMAPGLQPWPDDCLVD
ncbi:MAG TPA: class I SAM-dependent methyltransferase [Vicinamibacterales bacterium]|nr:class I SAM-dependent methyltransferase [Vicinamibacterales bacterium]